MNWLSHQALFCLLLLLGGGVAVASQQGEPYRGGGSTLVVVGQTQEPSGFELRMKAELEAVGFTVKLVNVDMRGEPRRELDAAARREAAGAGVLCLETRGYVELWIADRVTGKVVYRRVTIPQTDAPDSFVALSTVELLRASLLEVNTSHRKAGEVASSKVVNDFVAPRPSEVVEKPPGEPLFSIQVSPDVLMARFDGPPMMNLFLGFDFRFHRVLELALSGEIPLVRSTVEGDGGSASIRLGRVGMGVDYVFAKPDGRFRADLGLGWTLLLYRMGGTAQSGYVGHETMQATSSPYLRLGAEVVAARHFRVRLDANAGWSISKVQVVISDEPLAEFGHFWLGIGLGIVFAL